MEGAEDAIDQAIAVVQQHEIGFNDVLVAVAASGTTPFTLSCLKEAKTRGDLTVGVANNRDSLSWRSRLPKSIFNLLRSRLRVSTRMKAGTAQRITLNVFHPAHELLGRVFDGLMVELRAVNQKLVRRSEKHSEALLGASGAKRARRCDRQAAT